MAPESNQEDNESSHNPYLDPYYSRQKLLDLFHLTQSSLTRAQNENPNSPKVIAYQATMAMISLALIFKKH